MPTYLYPSSSHSRSSSSGSHYRGSSYSPSHHRHSTYGGSVYGHGSSYGNHGSRSQHSYAPPYQYTSSSGSRGYGSRSAYPVYGDYGRDHHRDYSRSGARHQYVTQDTGRHHGHGLFSHHVSVISHEHSRSVSAHGMAFSNNITITAIHLPSANG
ncbi:hypothetical protein SCHPADRAFT_217235 [Schizopora paradoxa]|uniref:Uncharacterized protein n=1 Tax=Schizopora paradoxa TaxID=27342 RepID=A0A0H2RWB5_9AGAM|nr:hypothetical protein SCHPADRAFT_217235 [Schizopora paradoxa]